MLYVLFEIGADRFLLRASEILRLTSYCRPRPVPASPAGLIGLLPFQGSAVPIVDPAMALTNATSRQLRSTRIAYCRDSKTGHVLGVILESAVETARLADSDFSVPPLSMERCRCAGDLALVDGVLAQRVEVSELASDEVWRLVANASQEATP